MKNSMTVPPKIETKKTMKENQETQTQRKRDIYLHMILWGPLEEGVWMRNIEKWVKEDERMRGEKWRRQEEKVPWRVSRRQIYKNAIQSPNNHKRFQVFVVQTEYESRITGWLRLLSSSDMPEFFSFFSGCILILGFGVENWDQHVWDFWILFVYMKWSKRKVRAKSLMKETAVS